MLWTCGPRTDFFFKVSPNGSDLKAGSILSMSRDRTFHGNIGYEGDKEDVDEGNVGEGERSEEFEFEMVPRRGRSVATHEKRDSDTFGRQL